MAFVVSSTVPSWRTPSRRLCWSSALKLRSASSSFAFASGLAPGLIRSRSCPRELPPAGLGNDCGRARIGRTRTQATAAIRRDMPGRVFPNEARIATALALRGVLPICYTVARGMADRAAVRRAVARMLEASGLDELFAAAGADAPVLRAVLADLARGRAGRWYGTGARIARRRGFTAAYAVDRAAMLWSALETRRRDDLYRALGVPPSPRPTRWPRAGRRSFAPRIPAG